MQLKLLLLSLFFLSLPLQLFAQRTYDKLARDTIIKSSDFLGSSYYLDGKKISLPVMEWFMSDYPLANDAIRVAVVSDQLSVIGYTLGGIFLVSGVFTVQQGQPDGQELIIIGGILSAGGLLFQSITNAYKRKAVGVYNREIKALYRDGAGLQFKSTRNGIGLAFVF